MTAVYAERVTAMIGKVEWGESFDDLYEEAIATRGLTNWQQMELYANKIDERLRNIGRGALCPTIIEEFAA